MVEGIWKGGEWELMKVPRPSEDTYLSTLSGSRYIPLHQCKPSALRYDKTANTHGERK